MSFSFKKLFFLIALIFSGFLSELPSMAEDFSFSWQPSNLIVFQQNTLFPLENSEINLENSPRVVRKIQVIVTAYSSTPWETDDTPYITAAGTLVREGIVANNFFPFGTKVKFPEIFGDKIFVVEDRMDWRKSNYHFDIWFPSYEEAKKFGAKLTIAEILETNE